MKKKNTASLLLLISLFFVIVYLNNNSKNNNDYSIQELRKKHSFYLDNSPFKETLFKKKGNSDNLYLPGKQFSKELFRITMNPITGYPEPQKIFKLQKKLKTNKNISGRVPGDALDNKWIERGPTNVGGRTRTLLFDPNDPTNKRVFAGAVSGGLWVNDDITDENSSWNIVEDVPGNLNVSCIVTDPRNSNIWYLGTGEQYNWNTPSGNGLYKSVDGGESWNNVEIIKNQTNIDGIFYINDIIIRISNDKSEIYVGVGAYGPNSGNNNGVSIVPVGLGLRQAGLYKSIDDGSTWNRIENENLKWSYFDQDYYYIPNDFEISADNKIWMSTISPNGLNSPQYGGGRIFSSNNGVNWLEAPISPIGEFENRIEIAVSSTNRDKLYALTQNSIIYASEDGFNTINELSKPNDAAYNIPAENFTNNQGWYNLVIEVDPNDDDIVYLGGICLFKSTKGPNSSEVEDWKQISKYFPYNTPNLNFSLIHADQHALTFRPGNSNQAVIGNDGGVYFSDDLANSEKQETIHPRNKNYNVTQFYFGAYGQNEEIEEIIGGAQDNGTQNLVINSTGINQSFRITGGDGMFCDIDKEGEYVISSSQKGRFLHIKKPLSSQDIGPYHSERNINQYMFGNPCIGPFTSLASLDHNLDILYASEFSIITKYELGDRSVLNEEIIDLHNFSNSFVNDITSIKVSPFTTSSSTVIAGTITGQLFELKNTNLEKDQILFREITGESFVGSISDIEYGKTENDILITLSNYGIQSVWYTSNAGETWHNKNGNLPDIPIFCIKQNPISNNEVIIGTMLGVWSSKNFNEQNPTWERSSNGMKDVMVLDLDLRESDNSVLASSFGRGLFTGNFQKSTNSYCEILTDMDIITTCDNSDEVTIDFDYITEGDFNEITNLSIVNTHPNLTYSLNKTSIDKASEITLKIDGISDLDFGDYTITLIAENSKKIQTDVILRKVIIEDIKNIELVFPENKSINKSVNNYINYSWKKTNSIDSYNIEIASDPGFKNIIENKIDIKSNSYRSEKLLDLNTVYYWRVSSNNFCTTNENSEIYKFKTEPLKDCLTIDFDKLGYTEPIPIYQSYHDDCGAVRFEIEEDFIISDVNVSMELNHENLEDLHIVFYQPGNKPGLDTSIENGQLQLTLFNGICNSTKEIKTTFDDEASDYFNCTNSNLQIHKPIDKLSNFNGFGSKGGWQLIFYDLVPENSGFLNSLSIDFCKDQPIINSTFINNTINVGTNSNYFLSRNDIEAKNEETSPSDQIYMVSKLPENGILYINGNILEIGQTFTQEDINNENLVYTNEIPEDSIDNFEVDITNSTNGFLPNQVIEINIDSTIIGDNDNDGVNNDLDLCPDTPKNMNVDSNGCFTLPANNFTIETIGETCVGKNNGQVIISAIESYNYVISLNGSEYNFTYSKTISNLQPGIYDICITVSDIESYKQCYSILIEEGKTISGKSNVTSNKVSIDIEKGTSPYSIQVNGENVFNTFSSSFEVDVKHGDLVEVKTDVLCEGIFSKTINLFETVSAYPNPTTGIFEIDLPFIIKEVRIELFTINSQLINSNNYYVTNGKVELNIESMPSAVYLVKVYLDKPVSFKIIKI